LSVTWPVQQAALSFMPQVRYHTTEAVMHRSAAIPIICLFSEEIPEEGRGSFASIFSAFQSSASAATATICNRIRFYELAKQEREAEE